MADFTTVKNGKRNGACLYDVYDAEGRLRLSGLYKRDVAGRIADLREPDPAAEQPYRFERSSAGFDGTTSDDLAGLEATLGEPVYDMVNNETGAVACHWVRESARLAALQSRVVRDSGHRGMLGTDAEVAAEWAGLLEGVEVTEAVAA